MLIIIFMKILPPFLADFFNFFPFSETQMVTAGMARKQSVRNLLQRTEGRKPMRRLSGAPKDIVRLANSLVNGFIFGPKNGRNQNSLCQISCKEWVLFLDPAFRDIIPGHDWCTWETCKRRMRMRWGAVAMWFHMCRWSWLSHPT